MTIYALSTAPGRAGIAIIRISGEATRETLGHLCRGELPSPRFASLRPLLDPTTGEVLDRGIVLWFPSPGSFTGEDMAELHLHGGRAVVSGMLDALSSLGLRMAEPGEFTRRAFQNGKLDLTEAEGLADLINAETAVQRKQALAQSGGAMRARYEGWRNALLRAMAYVEASLDFSDEGEIAERAFHEATPIAEELAGELDRALADGRRGEILREGIQVAIVGAPNAGKSSLLNALAGRPAAIVFDEPGTTRDIIEITLDLDGFPFVLRDTAGLRETGSAVELEGIRRALAAAEDADIVLHVYDASCLLNEQCEWPPLQPTAFAEENSPSSLKGQNEHAAANFRATTIAVLNKADLIPKAAASGGRRVPGLLISAQTGEGLNELKAMLVSFAREAYGTVEPALITRARHRAELIVAHAALTQFLAVAETSDKSEIAAEHLREAADALARLTGRLDVEDVLGQIFSEFCIGK